MKKYFDGSLILCSVIASTVYLFYLKINCEKLKRPYFHTTKSCLPSGYWMRVHGTLFLSQNALRRALLYMSPSAPPHTIQRSLFSFFVFAA